MKVPKTAFLAISSFFAVWAVAPSAYAQSCGADAHEIARESTANGVRITCVCDAGYDRIGNRCERVILGGDELGARTGDAFTFGDRLRAAADRAVSRLDVRGLLHIRTLAAEAGRYGQALEDLFGDRVETAEAPDLRRLLDDEVRPAVLDLRDSQRPERDRAGPLALEAPDPDDLAVRSKAFGQAVVLANFYISHGAYGDAVGVLERAVVIAPANPELRQALTYAGQLKAERDAVSTRFPARDLAEVRRVASGRAAWRLGLHLIDKGDRAAAESVLREALAALSDGAHTRDTDLIREMVTTLRSGQPFPGATGHGLFEGRSKADLILDSLEFGSGDINRIHLLAREFPHLLEQEPMFS